MNADRLNEILEQFPRLSLAVVGDLFLDKYWEIDPALCEVSLETSLDAHQIVNERVYPGAAGTVINNLVALGVGRIYPIGFTGDEGNGLDLRRALSQKGVVVEDVLTVPERRTPAYIKPMILERGKPPRQLERMDIKNRKPLPVETEQEIIARVERRAAECDGLIAGDQVEENNCGVVTDRVREAITGLGRKYPEKILFADSRFRVGLFQSVIIKPNQAEAARSLGLEAKLISPTQLVSRLSAMTGRPACITFGERGILAFDGREALHLPGYVGQGTVDIVGAGDSLTAGMVGALCAGATIDEAALIGNLVASITVEQIGVTGTASSHQVRRRFEEYRRRFPEICAKVGRSARESQARS